MNKEIKEILDRLERIDHKENKTAFEFADSATFDEMARCFKERKMMADYITNLQESEAYYYGQYKDYKLRNEKAKSLTNRTIEIIKQQPSGNDEWILERLNGINYCLGGDEE